MISTPLAMFGLPGGTEWILIALFGLFLFGKRLPELGRSLGQSITEFKRGLASGHDHKPSKPPEQLTDEREQD